MFVNISTLHIQILTKTTNDDIHVALHVPYIMYIQPNSLVDIWENKLYLFIR